MYEKACSDSCMQARTRCTQVYEFPGGGGGGGGGLTSCAHNTFIDVVFTDCSCLTDT